MRKTKHNSETLASEGSERWSLAVVRRVRRRNCHRETSSTRLGTGLHSPQTEPAKTEKKKVPPFYVPSEKHKPGKLHWWKHRELRRALLVDPNLGMEEKHPGIFLLFQRKMFLFVFLHRFFIISGILLSFFLNIFFV